MTRPDPAPHFAAVAAAVAAPGQPGALFAALEAGMRGAIGHRLFTILVADPEAGHSQRFYSNMPDAYPVGGRKPIAPTPWFARVLGEGDCYVGRSYDDIRDVFYDHELIRSLGCESVLNVPVRWDGRSLGTLNLLHEAGFYSEADVATGRLFAALAVPGLLAVHRQGGSGADAGPGGAGAPGGRLTAATRSASRAAAVLAVRGPLGPPGRAGGAGQVGGGIPSGPA
ncbi:GAF domain-containing protein [Roseomonas sp. CCTCC AB2023176]|uniref:GAF domain-containing protein n=1 Tax=Roseomonas sp. CCTCC AB2023176 TaxID=3342640 RepID=UPI0035D64042